MAEFFKGLAIGMGLRDPDEQIKLKEMIASYHKDRTVARPDAAEMIKNVIELSPDLKARTLEVVRDGHLRSYTDRDVQVGGSASYHVHDGSIRTIPDPRDPLSTMFTLGHETEHARSQRGVNYIERTLVPAIERVAGSPGDPRDYTQVVLDYVERTRAEEGRAHLGGFNALSSYIMKHQTPKPGEELRDLYEACPGRMGDFISKSTDSVPPKYALKPGLTMTKEGQLPYTDENISAMKVYYADKAQLGAAHMNYRQESIEVAKGLIVDVEKQLAERRFENRNYVIDPDRLQAHPLLGLPVDGRMQAKGVPDVVALDLGSLDLPPLVVSGGSKEPQPSSSSSSSVVLEPQGGDHPLFAQALTQVVELSKRDNLGTPEQLRNLSAALALSAQERGLRSIDSIAHSSDGKGLIATQGSGDVAVHARVEGLTAIATPERQSLDQLKPLAQSSPEVESPSKKPVTL